MIDLIQVKELKTISNKDSSEFDRNLNSSLLEGWILIKLFEVQESTNKHHMYSAHLAKFYAKKVQI